MNARRRCCGFLDFLSYPRHPTCFSLGNNGHLVLCRAQAHEAELTKREAALLKVGLDEAEASLEKERQAASAAEARSAKEAERAAAETGALRQQLDNAVSRRQK